MKNLLPSCPVPIEQQPIKEYENLKNSVFFFWTTENVTQYYKTTLTLVSVIYLLTGIGLKSADLGVELSNYLSLTCLIGSIFNLLFFLRIYIGWEYVYNRLKKATVSYEESGWYDGQTWIKTPDILIKDSLVADYVLFPILSRVKLTISILVIPFLFSIFYI